MSSWATNRDAWAPPAFVSLGDCAPPPLQLGAGSAPKNSSGCMGGGDGARGLPPLLTSSRENGTALSDSAHHGLCLSCARLKKRQTTYLIWT
jgi:hypothetical protein